MRRLLALSSFFLSLPLIFYLGLKFMPQSLPISSSPQTETHVSSNIYAALPEQAPSVEGVATVGDARPLILRNYFKYYDSPLFPLADYIVKISDQYSFDFRLLPAIAMQESNLCKVIPPDSHNCWGYGIYADKVVKFDSYEQGIKRVAQTIAEDYIAKGLTTPEKIMRRYTPPSDGSWADGVSYFLDIMEKGGVPE